VMTAREGEIGRLMSARPAFHSCYACSKDERECMRVLRVEGREFEGRLPESSYTSLIGWGMTAGCDTNLRSLFGTGGAVTGTVGAVCKGATPSVEQPGGCGFKPWLQSLLE